MTKTTTKASATKTAAPKTTKADQAATESKQTKADAAKARAAGLGAAETASLDPENRVPKARVAEDDAAGSQHTDEEVASAVGAKELTLISINVQIERDPMIKIGKRVFEHEIPILQALHGEDKIEIQDGTEREETVTISADQEYERLIRTRGEKGAKALRLIYPNAASLAADLGLPSPQRRSFSRNRLQEKSQSAQRGAGV